MPAEKTSRLWVERTARDFVFDIKSFRLFTQHPTPVKALPEEAKQKTSVYHRDLPEELKAELWTRFERALLPLDSAGKLGAVFLQFPPWFHPGDEQREYILSCKEKLPQYRLAVEFRHNSWLNDKNRERTLDFLKTNSLAMVCVDEPQGFRSSVPPVAVATADLAVVRFHGRNTETWDKKEISVPERFNYLYSQEELAEWASKIRDIASRVTRLHVLFNNCHEDKAVVNAGQMKMMLG